MPKLIDYSPVRKRAKKTRQGQGKGSKFGNIGSKKYYRKKKRGQG